MKHTPGPWAANWSTRINGGRKEGWFVEAESAYDRGWLALLRVFDTYGVIANLPDGRSNTAANAQLIAAAPDMLAALQHIQAELAHPEIGNVTAVGDMLIREAIAKAEGRAEIKGTAA